MTLKPRPKPTSTNGSTKLLLYSLSTTARPLLDQLVDHVSTTKLLYNCSTTARPLLDPCSTNWSTNLSTTNMLYNCSTTARPLLDHVVDHNTALQLLYNCSTAARSPAGPTKAL